MSDDQLVAYGTVTVFRADEKACLGSLQYADKRAKAKSILEREGGS